MRPIKPFIMAGLLAGCATVTHGPEQRVMVSTPGAPQADCTITSTTLGTRKFKTPEAINIPRSSEKINITCTKKCFEDATRAFEPVINGEDLAIGGLIGGLGPVAIDAATKRAYNYAYDFVIPMTSNHKCSSHRKGFLQGDQKDFDNQIKDFNFDEAPEPLPEIVPDNKKTTNPNAVESSKIK